MGLCFSRKQSRRLSNQSSSAGNGGIGGSNRWSRIRSTKKEEPIIHERALAAAILLQQQLQNAGAGSGVPFDRSTSLRYPNGGSAKRNQTLPRSSSSRARSLTDPLLHPHQLLNQMPDYISRTTTRDGHIEDIPINKLELFRALVFRAYLNTKDVKLEGLETNHFVLVHGGGFGAWCWYKSIALLEEAGFKVTAIDLTGSGVHSFDTNSITSLSQYVKPLSDFLEKLADGEKVILVAHDFGGACLSYSMELYPSKISKAVFIAAAMLTSGQSTLDMFSQKTDSNDLMRQAQIFLYANGNSHPPTAIDLDKSLLRDLLFNQSPSKDVALASVSMRPIPFLPVLEKLCLSDAKYGTVRRFYIETPDDNAIPMSMQESMVSRSPPEKVFRLKGADHSPFFSKPQALHKLLVEISKIP